MKTHTTWPVLIGLFLAVFGATASFGIDVKTDYDRGTNFHQYTTYSWDEVRTRDPLLVDGVKSEVNAAVEDKGWAQVATGGDISIVAIEITRTHPSLTTRTKSTSSDGSYKTGTLEIDLFDAKTNNLIWRGAVTDTLSNNSDKNIKNFDKGIQKMFEHFPPRSKK